MKYKKAGDSHNRIIKFDEGDLVWAVLTKERFPTNSYYKLRDRKAGSSEILRKINDGAYKLKLPSHLNTSDVFNVKHFTPYEHDDIENKDGTNLRTSFVSTRGH